MLDHEDYPGDEHFPPRKQSCWSYSYHFLVTAISPDILSILDSVQNTCMLVQHEFLKNPKLCVTSWYATQCQEYFHLPCEKGKRKEEFYHEGVYGSYIVNMLN